MKKGSGSGSPPIPPPDTDPRTPKMALFDPPGGGPKIAILGALRCRVRGGWGGSAHYPDPTAQSARSAETRRVRPAHPVPARPDPPGTPVTPVPRSPPPLLAGLVDLAAATRGVVKVAAAPSGVGDPRPGTGVPSRARSSGLTTARVSLSLKVGLEPTGISMSSVRSGVPP